MCLCDMYIKCSYMPIQYQNVISESWQHTHSHVDVRTCACDHVLSNEQLISFDCKIINIRKGGLSKPIIAKVESNMFPHKHAEIISPTHTHWDTHIYDILNAFSQRYIGIFLSIVDLMPHMLLWSMVDVYLYKMSIDGPPHVSTLTCFVCIIVIVCSCLCRHVYSLTFRKNKLIHFQVHAI